MEEQIKEIISVFIKTPADQISHQTIINQSVLKDSIMLHRMYGQLAKQGVVLENYADIDNFGMLLQRIQSKEIQAMDAPVFSVKEYTANTGNESPLSIGVDLEEIGSLPPANDFREESFYTMNFSPAEIAYCILQQNPYASFAGLFAAKEAIVKADNTYKQKQFNSIHIDHEQGGKPVHGSFQLSITHTDSVAMAVAVQLNNSSSYQSKNIPAMTPHTGSRNSLATLIAVISFLLALIAIIFAVRH